MFEIFDPHLWLASPVWHNSTVIQHLRILVCLCTLELWLIFPSIIGKALPLPKLQLEYFFEESELELSYFFVFLLIQAMPLFNLQYLLVFVLQLISYFL